jgi:hypothetical protein
MTDDFLAGIPFQCDNLVGVLFQRRHGVIDAH